MTERTEETICSSAGGEMARRIRAYDWAETPLGAMEAWPQSLKAVVDLMIANPVANILVCGPERIILYNDACIALYGDKHPCALGARGPDAFPELWNEIGPLYDRVFAGEQLRFDGQPWAFDRGTDAQPGLYDAFFAPGRDESGQVAFAYVTAVEVTNKVRLDAALREREERLRALVTTGSQMVYRMSPDWRLMYQLDGRDILADTTEPITDWTEKYHLPEDRAQIFAAIRDAIASKSPFQLEHRVRRADGSIGWVLSRAVPILGSDGEITEWFGAGIDITARREADAALRESEEKYRSLFETMTQGYDECELIRDAAGKPIDYRVLDANPAFERLLGLPVNDIRGKRVREIIPSLEDWWPKEIGHIVDSGEPGHVEHEVASFERFYEVTIYPRGQDRFTALFDDITERKRAEAVLRESEERQAFLLKLGDTLRPLADPIEIMAAASEALGRHLDAGRCGYGEVDESGDYFIVERDWTDGVMPSFVGRHFFGFGDQFREDYRAGKSVLIDDALADARAAGKEAAFEAAGGVRAALGLPLIKEGRFVAGFFVQQLEPRHWTEQDEALSLEVAERTWAAVERARAEAALRASEEKYRTLFEKMGQGYALGEVIRDEEGRAVDLRYLELNPAFERLSGISVVQAQGRTVREVYGEVEPEWFEVAERVARLKVPERVEYEIGAIGRWFQMHFYPAEGDRYLGLYEDVTDRKRAEAVLRESEERQTFLLKFNDALRAEEGAEAVGDLAVRMIANELVLDRVYLVTANQHDDKILITHEVRREDMPPMLGVYRSSDFPKAIEEFYEHKIVYTDVRTDPRLTALDRASLAGLGAVGFAAVPINRGDEGLIWAIGAVSTEPRQWTASDLALLEDAAERTWAAIERARAEAALRASEERQAFLLKLSDALRPLGNAEDVTAAACRLLVEHLDASRAQYTEIEGPLDAETGNVRGEHLRAGRPMARSYPLAGFGESMVSILRRGEPVILNDTDTDPRLNQAQRDAYRAVDSPAAVAVGLVKEGRLVATFAVHQTTPRDWTAAEIELVKEVSERTWAAVERARAEAAMRDSETRLRTLVQSLPGGAAFIVDNNLRYLLAEGEALTRAGFKPSDLVGRTIFETLPAELARAYEPNYRQALAGEPFELEHDAHGRTFITRGAPLPSHNGDIPAALVVSYDITDRKQAEEALRESEERFRQFGEASSDVLWIRGAEALQWEYLSTAFDAVYGEDREKALEGNDLRRWAEMILPEDREQALANIGRVREGERVTFEYRIRRLSDGQVRWLRDTDFPLLDEAGRVQRIGGIGHDATEEKEFSDRLQVLVAELQHRTRNLIAVVQSLAQKTRKESVSLDDFQIRYDHRLKAVSRVQGLLSRLGEGERITFDELLDTELSALGALDGHADRVRLDGPKGVRLRSSTIQTFALALHELATNAVKYGALSSPDGHLAVRWHVATDGAARRLHVEWRESGVAMLDEGVTARGGGYGRELIERALPYQLNAETSYEMGADGVLCTIAVPISEATPPRDRE